MADFQIISRPFPNGGLQLKQDPALLDEAHYSELTNMVSIQEGDLAIRPGNQKLTGTGTFVITTGTVSTTASAIHSIAGLRIGSQGVETLYIGEGQNIWANRTTLTTMSTWVTVATGCAPTVAAGDYPRQRFSGSPYSAGSSGLPYEYFACPSKMLKSDGTTAALQKWGIDRPVQPAIIALGGQAGGILPANADLIISPGGGLLNGIGSPTTITSFTGTAPGNIVVTPNNLYLHQIQVGMLLHIGPTASPQYAVVLSVDPTTFTVNLGSTPSAGDVIQTASLVSILTGTDQVIPITPVTIDASYSGLPADGYSTNDLVHLGLTFSDVTHYSKLSLRVYVGGSSVDYYEILIIDPTDWAGSVSRNNLHSGGPFTELNFPKNTFTAVGYAGTAPYSWKFVTGFEVVFSTYAGVGFTQVDLNCLYFSAVNGPNANATGGNTVAVFTPYHYVFCVTADTPILCDDLAWRPAGDLAEGQGIIAFDENEALYQKKRCTRRFRKAHIVHNVREKRECFEIRTDIGDPVKATGDHPWLVWSDIRRIDGHTWGGLEWKKTSDLKNGDRIAHYAKPWSEEESKSAGWLAGIFDGEGHLSLGKQKTKSGATITTLAIGIAQNPGPVLERIIKELDVRGITYYRRDQNKHGNASSLQLTGSRAVMRFLGVIRPQRLLDKFQLKGMGHLPGLAHNRSYDFATVVSVSPVGEQEVASIQTSSGTFITGGYLSHNTFRNPITGAEGNPSVEQISTSWVTPLNQSVSVQCLGTTDPQITGANSIAVYRAGGAFADNFYRFVGYATNPGTATLVTFIDQQSDQNILVANTADFDNDPPVTSSLPTPLIMTSNTVVVAGTISTVTVTATSGNLSSAHVGSNATVGVNSSSQESAVIAGVNVTASTMDLFFQYAHSDAATNPITIQVNSITGQPANLCLEAADSMFVAGDPNNPHVLYKSKTGRPEAFPILNFTTNIAQAINVGTPSDYIVNITEYNGGVLCLNLNSIYYVRVVSGIMETPLSTPAQRGLLAKDAWCQIDNEIWYLSYDGVYSWSGGASQWRSAEIDPLFKGYTVGSYKAIDIRPNLGHAGADVITMESSGNEIFLSYQDTAGAPYRLRYHTKFNRWSIEQQTDPNIDPTLCAVTAQYNDKTTGILYLAKNPANIAHLYADNVGTSDGWSTAITDGADIPYSFTPAAITMGAPSFNKTFADVNLEYSGLVDGVTLGCFYDFAAVTTTPGDTFTLAATSGRAGTVVSLQNGFQKEAYAMQTRFSGASNQAWRFYSMTVNVVPLTQIQVGRAYDWDDLGWPYDKRLYQLVMEYDIPSGQTVVMNMDTMTGVIGVQAETSAVQTFTLSPPTSTTAGTPNRITANFALNDDMIVKKVRIRPSVTTVPFKHFSYSFPEFTKYPADTTLFTEWSDLGYPGDKVLRTLNLEMNSNGLPCVVQIQGDAGNLGAPQTVTTTLNDRARILTLESDLITKNTRLVMTPAAGGYSQYFKHSFDFWKEPLAVTHWDSYEFNFGYNGYNFVKQAWLEYTCLNPILVTFFGDYGEEFYSITLPAHPQRDIERFYLPDYTVDVDDQSIILNKSKRKRITIDVVQSPS